MKLPRLFRNIVISTIFLLPIFPAQAAPANSTAYLETEKAADAEIATMEKECLFEDEKPTVKRKPGFKKSVAVGNDQWVFIVDGEKLSCIRASMCGTGGCQLRVISGASGVPKILYERQARGWKLIKSSSVTPYLRLDSHGSHCNKTGAEACFEKLDLKTGIISRMK